jgi:hypothetical protein
LTLLEGETAPSSHLQYKTDSSAYAAASAS